MTDKDQILAYKKSRDLQVLQKLYLSYQPYLFRQCMSILKHPQDSEDACVEIFLILKDKLLAHDVEYFPSWLFMVTRNHCLKKLRSKGKMIFESEENILDKGEIEEKQDHIDEYLHNLPEAIDQLEETQRKCIVFFFLHGKSYKEIEQLFGFPFNKIKSSIQNGKKNLRKIIMEQ